MTLLVYRESYYFNEQGFYLFDVGGKFDTPFVSRVSFYNGCWYANENVQYKATTIRCFSIPRLD